jgi:ribosomal protein L37E
MAETSTTCVRCGSQELAPELISLDKVPRGARRGGPRAEVIEIAMQHCGACGFTFALDETRPGVGLYIGKHPKGRLLKTFHNPGEIPPTQAVSP